MLTFDTNYKPDYSENRLKIIEVPDSVVLTCEELEKIIGDAFNSGIWYSIGKETTNEHGNKVYPPTKQQYISSVIKQG